MPLSLADLESLRSALFAEDVQIPPNATSWSEDDATAFFESGGTKLPGTSTPPAARRSAVACEYRVTHDYVVVRAEPKRSSGAVGKKERGQVVACDLRGGFNNNWVRLKEELSGGRRGWLMIDATPLGLGPLLQLVSGSPPPTEEELASPPKSPAAARPSAPPSSLAPSVPSGPASTVVMEAPVAYEVAHSLVFIRKAPDRSAAEIGQRAKGAVVHADARNGGWVRLVADGTPTGASVPDASSDGGGWMLLDATGQRVAGVSGALLKPHVVQLPPGTKWQVTRANGCPHGYATPGGAASGVEGRSRALGSLCAHGAEVEVEAECGLWVRIKAEAPTWVEMDAFFMG